MHQTGIQIHARSMDGCRTSAEDDNRGSSQADASAAFEVGPSEVTNADFIAALFPALLPGAFAAVCTKDGDPTNGGWVARRADLALRELTEDRNNYVAGSSFYPSDDGTFSVRKERAAFCSFLLLDDLKDPDDLARLSGFTLSWLIRTSPGNLQGGILFKQPVSDVVATELHRALVKARLCDPGATGPSSRWARLPVGINGKRKYRNDQGKPFRCELVHLSPGARYTPHEIIDRLGLDVESFPGRREPRTASMEPSIEPPTGPLDLPRLSSALKSLPADCDEATWKLRRLGAMARAARTYPDSADELYLLARSWSSGELCGSPAKAWTTPGTNGLTGAAAFDKEWERFLGDTRGGPVNTIGTIFHDAREAGWRDESKTSPPPMVDMQTKGTIVQPQLMAMFERLDAGDVGAPLEPANIAVLAQLQRQDLAEFTRVRNRIKILYKGVPITALDRAIRAQQPAPDVAPTHHGYAKGLVHELTYGGFQPVYSDGSMHVVETNHQIWTAMDQKRLERRVAELYDTGENCKRSNDYAGIAEHAKSLVGDDSFFHDAPVGLACPDGFYQIIGNETQVVPLTPALRQRVLLNISPRKVPTPAFDAFLHDTFKSENEGEEAQQIMVVQEIAGSVMLGIMPRLHKVALFYEPYGRAGKGTLVSILTQLVPRPFVSAVSPNRWNNEYYLIKLAGARLNVVAELPENDPIPAADFKSVIGGDLLSGRHPHGRPVVFRNQATHLFSSNHLITSRDQSEAFFARWLIVEFPNSRLVSGLPLKPGLAEEIIAAELQGIAYWAWEGAKRLLANNRFSKSDAHDRLMSEWRRGNSSLEGFIHEECELGPEYNVRRADFYGDYKTWCLENGRKPLSKAHVKEQLQHNVGLGIAWASLHGNEIFRGVRLKPKIEADFDGGLNRVH
jgi:P4 family phage/plasmid primase-like protien